MFYLFGKIEARDHSLSHDKQFYERKHKQSLCDFEKYNLQKYLYR